MDRRGLIVMTLDECERLLSEQEIGRVAVVTAGEPLVLPVLYSYARGSVVFRTAAGEKLDAAWQNAAAAFEIDGWDTSSHTGWSVLLRGQAEAVTQQDEIADLEQLELDEWIPSEQPTTWVRIRSLEITGRRIA